MRRSTVETVRRAPTWLRASAQITIKFYREFGMPLLDHFHPPLSDTRHWESFHARWAAAIADELNEKLLPAGYYAEEQVHVGGRVEIDVASSERGLSSGNEGRGGTATLPVAARALHAPDSVMPAVFPDVIEVLVFDSEAGPTLVAAVELISPGNKDRADARRAFAAKCAAYLQQGIGMVITDTVTSRQANLHNELIQLMEADAGHLIADRSVYTASYRPALRNEQPLIEV
jgi:hypothetical protein